MIREIKFGIAIAQVAYRFWTGRPLDGERKTNATFWTPATRSLDPSGKALRWEMMRGAARLAYRVGALYLLLLLFVSLLFLLFGVSPARLLLLHLGVGGLCLAGYVHARATLLHGYRFPIPVRRESSLLAEEEILLLQTQGGDLLQLEQAEKVEKRWGVEWIVRDGREEWEKEKVLPVAVAAQGILGCSWTEKQQRKHVHVPRSYLEPGGERVEILLPPSFTGADLGVQTRLVGSVSARLGIRDPLAAWQLEGSVPRVLIGTQPAPPALVRFGEVRHFFEAAEEYTPFYGVIAGGEGLHIGMHSDTPHMAISAGSGAGKSEMIKVLVMQALRWGWSVIILDWKEESQEWAKGLPGVRYYSSEEKIHDAGVSIAKEISRRKENPGEPRVPILTVCEEWSMTADLLSEYWALLRSTADPLERQTMPVRSPALTGIKKMIFTGRSLGLFQMLVAIRFSARVTGGNADLRESFQVILMARYKAQTVNMLARGIKPFPKNKPKEVGRWVAVMGEEAVIFRAPLVTNDEARKWALGGIPCPASPWGSSGRSGKMQPDLENRPTLGVAEATEIHPKALSDMLEELKDIDASITLKILRNAAGDNMSGFPAAAGIGARGAYLYDPESVRMWTARRFVQRELKARR